MDRKIQTLDAARLNEFEQKLRQDLNQEAIFSPAKAEPISLLLKPEAIQLDSSALDKTEVLRNLVTLAEATGNVLDPERLYASIVEREYLCSTAFPGGFAICHPRRPIPTALLDYTVCLLRLKQPIQFGAEDGSLTQLFFLLSAPNDKLHLHGLARLARILRGDALKQLLTSASVEEILNALRTAENNQKTVPGTPEI
ncbi:MAG: PTS sugar transporter subunit IIA [Verrucomicrobia bacterium]|nr:PTS sugar transporter subunit IIA [Verrucomicrobiota bacterium]